MEREQLEHLIRAAAQVTHEYEFVIVGSQSILGPVPNPPQELKASMEADMYPLNAPEKADLLDGNIGEGSWFHTTHQVYAQGVGPETAVLSFALGWLGTAAAQGSDCPDRLENWLLLGRAGLVHVQGLGGQGEGPRVLHRAAATRVCAS